ncbi:MAG: M43 family zinc metalloprotease [Bacteroidota bacterium]|nr:M43 family zinc metalloprotease [Bacteroidota bacterium]
MRKITNLLMIPVFFSGIFTLNAQQVQEKCATMHLYEKHLNENPQMKKKINTLPGTSRWISNTSNIEIKGRMITIPVVVHVLYHPDSSNQNILDAVIQSQIDVLNEDFRRTNADTSDTRQVFHKYAADAGVQFQLASVDPNGSPTTGITRTSTTSSFSPLGGMDRMKSSTTGGKDPWPSDKYLNIWVCDMSFFGFVFVLGYAQFPGDDPLTDGVVIQYQHFGRTNNPNAAPANIGRTATHEVGHWMGLYHIWGDDNGTCTGSDSIADTPNQGNNSNSDCDKTINSCMDSPFDYPDMVENYMDYSSDNCMNIFTKGQSQRMWGVLETYRQTLFTSNGCGSEDIQILPLLNSMTCLGSCDGSINLQLFSGTPPYDISWSNGETTPSINNLCAGTYTANITDATSATAVVEFTLFNPDTLLLIGHTIQNSSCYNCNDGSISVVPHGGIGNYTYSWNTSPVQTTQTASNLSPGIYTVVVSDGCQTVTYTDSVNDPFVGISVYNQLEKSLSIYPNPVSNFLNIEYSSDIKDLKIEMWNVSGELIRNIENSGNGIISFDISEFPVGIYFLKISSGGAFVAKKISLIK